jgi:hypothetical protein
MTVRPSAAPLLPTGGDRNLLGWLSRMFNSLGNEQSGQLAGSPVLVNKTTLTNSPWRFNVNTVENDFMKRGFLLPDGCKDLIDVLKPKAHPMAMPGWTSCQPQLKQFTAALPASKHPTTLPPIVGEMVIPEQTSVSQLAVLLGQKPFKIVAEVLHLGFFVSAKQPLSFEIISSVVRKYGFIAKREI